MAKIDDSVKKKVPELRFPGFTDDWEERKLGDTLTELKSGLSRMLSNNDIGLPVVRANNINDGQFNIDSDVKYWYVNDPQGANTVNYLIRKNDILINFINSEAKMGTATIVENTPIRDTIYTTNILRARLKKEYDSYYWFALTQINQYKINIKIITKPAVNQASFTTVDFKKLNFMFPNLKEQQKIGSFFKQLDDTIALHQRKLDLLKEQKKGFLQKMFPKNGAKVPELRFAGFADDWEERKLGDVVGEIQSGNRLPKDSLTSGNIPYVVAQTKNEGVFKTISKKTLDYNGNPMKLFPGNSISFSIDNPEAMFYRSTEFYTSNIMRVIHADYLSHQQYLFILENMKSFTRGYDWSRKFSGPVVSNLEYLQPNEQEQCKIGSFILAFDNIITLHQRKLDLLKEQKKGYLQKMFPKNGEKVPELRFAGFADDWEDRKLGDFLKTPEKVKAHIQSKDDLMTLKLNLGGLESGSNRETLELGSTIYYKRKAGQFIYGKQNFFNGSMAIIPIDLDGKATSGDVPSLDVVGILSEYLYVYVSRGDYWKSKESEASGTGSKRIHEKTLQGFDIKVPSTQNEQRKIGSFFKQLDNTIALHQRKLDLLKEQKKGFLQKMFV